MWIGGIGTKYYKKEGHGGIKEQMWETGNSEKLDAKRKKTRVELSEKL